MLPRLLRHRGVGADPGRRAGAVSDAGQGGRAPRGRWILHPFLIGLFPTLFLYSHNVYETSPRSLVLPIGLTLAATLALRLALLGLTRDVQRSGLATSLLVALFFAFGQCAAGVNYTLTRLSGFWIKTFFDVPPLVTIGAQCLMAAPVLYLIFRRVKDPGPWSGYLNAFAAVLVALPAGRVAAARAGEPASPIIRGDGGLPIASRPARLPDIYYIILDAYARTDVMKELFGFDNGPFLDRLERKGFYIARESRSNYCFTSLSLCSTLNCDYLDRLIAPGAHDKDPLGVLIRDNLVVKSLRPLGYRFVAFSSGYEFTECTNADLFLNPRHPADNFQMMLIRMTPLRHLPFDVKAWDFYASMRERIRFILDHLPEVTREEGPTFTFAHIISPHQPFVLGKWGEDRSPKLGVRSASDSANEYHEGYRDQAIYLTGRIEQAIDQILARSPEPPIIILQSDHGSGLRHHLNDLEKTDLRERMSILNCYYFPERNYQGLTQTITPVNSFRVLLNDVFGAKLPLLEDRNLFSPYEDSYRFTDVTDRIGLDSGRGKQYTPAESYIGIVH